MSLPALRALGQDSLSEPEIAALDRLVGARALDGASKRALLAILSTERIEGAARSLVQHIAEQAGDDELAQEAGRVLASAGG